MTRLIFNPSDNLKAPIDLNVWSGVSFPVGGSTASLNRRFVIALTGGNDYDSWQDAVLVG
jgi:hypothetical protein